MHVKPASALLSSTAMITPETHGLPTTWSIARCTSRQS